MSKSKPKSELQIIAQRRNSSKGRIKGLRNNIRGLLADKKANQFLTSEEREQLSFAEQGFDNMLTCWDSNWEQIKSDIKHGKL